MATEIRGTAEESTKMMLGQVREVFEPAWIQAFGNGRFTVQFTEDSPATDELIAFAEMYGYELRAHDDGETGWESLYFK
jgi:hypothetical protein